MTKPSAGKSFSIEHPHKKQIEKLEAEINAHPGAISTRHREELVRGFEVLRRNTRDLLHHLNLAQTNEALQIELVQTMDAPTVRDEYFAKLDQRLHNALASAVSLVDQTRPFMKSYDGQPISIGFAERNKAVAAVPRNQFLRRFRNYLLHYGVAPFTTTATSQNGGPMTTTILLDTVSLLEWSDWTAVSRTFLAAHPEGLKLDEVVGSYFDDMQGLYSWLILELDGIHHADIEAANVLISKRNGLLSLGEFKSKEAFDAAIKRMVLPPVPDTFRRRPANHTD